MNRERGGVKLRDAGSKRLEENQNRDLRENESHNRREKEGVQKVMYGSCRKQRKKEKEGARRHTD